MDQKELTVLQGESIALYTRLDKWLDFLDQVDKQRVDHAKKLLAAKNPDQVTQACIDLSHHTRQSERVIKRVENLFEKITELNEKVSSTLEQAKTDSPEKEFLSQLIDSISRLNLISTLFKKNLSKVIKLRKKQLLRIELLVKDLDGINRPFFSYFYKRNFKKINSYLREEMNLTTKFKIREESDLQKITHFLETARTEKKWKLAVTALAVVFIFAPLPAVSVVGLGIVKGYDYINKHTKNCQEFNRIMDELSDKKWALA